MPSSDTQLVKLDFNKGFNKNSTAYSNENWWVDGDKVRFRNGRPEKMGGYVGEIVSHNNDATNTTFTGVARDAHSWVDLNSNKYLAAATHAKVEVMNGNQIYDITPYREELSLTDAISTTSGESEVTITDVNHELVVGDYVFVDSQADPVDGIDLSGEYQVTEVVDLDNYKIDSGTVASGTTALDGGALEINYLLEVGDIDNGDITGYGGGTWSTPGLANGGFGMPRAGVGGVYLRQWSLDNWGEDLIAGVRDGKIYHWDATNGLGTRLQELANAPERNFIVKVAQPSRHLVAFGSELAIDGVFDPLVIRWASQETLTEWEITETNSAGEYRLPLGNYIVGVVQTKGEIIIFTDSTVYSMRYVGGNEIFYFDIIADNVTAVSQHCGVDVNGIVYWMGVDNFYMYDGVVRTLPCTLSEHVFDQDGGGKLNFFQKEKTYCSTNNEFNEIMWLYPSDNSNDIDRYVIFNYLENCWYDGEYERTVWMDRSVFSKPYAIDASGKLFVHEQGYDADGSPLPAFIQSGDLDLKDGTEIMFMDRFIPDFRLRPNRNANLYLTFKKFPNSTGQVKGPYVFNNSTGQIRLRGRGRHVNFKYEVNTLGADFEIGSPRFGIMPDGGR